MPLELRDAKILITGPTGQVALPLALALARENAVWGVARFSDPKARARLEQAGVRCVVADLGTGDLSGVPQDVDFVLNFAVVRSPTPDFDGDLRANAEAAGLLPRTAGARARSCTARRPASTRRTAMRCSARTRRWATTTASWRPPTASPRSPRRPSCAMRRASSGCRR
jgi:hypothetical protein